MSYSNLYFNEISVSIYTKLSTAERSRMNKVAIPLHVAFRNCRRSSYQGSTVPESTRQKEISIRYNTLENFDRRFYPINDTSLNVTRKRRFYLQSRIEKLNIHVERRRKLFLLSVSQNHFRSPLSNL